ncbi:hypothetical protein ACJX0J_026779, partial [Zea mays]
NCFFFHEKGKSLIMLRVAIIAAQDEQNRRTRGKKGWGGGGGGGESIYSTIKYLQPTGCRTASKPPITTVVISPFKEYSELLLQDLVGVGSDYKKKNHFKDIIIIGIKNIKFCVVFNVIWMNSTTHLEDAVQDNRAFLAVDYIV